VNFRNLILPILITAVVIALAYVFKTILLYLVISLVLFLIGLPITARIEKIKIKGKSLHSGLSSLLTLILLFGVFYLLFILIIPPLFREISFMSGLNFHEVFHNIINQFPEVKEALNNWGDINELKHTLNAQANTLFNFGTVTSTINHFLNYLGSFVSGLFCVIFITFFLLKDQRLVHRTLLLLTPQRFEKEMTDIMRTSKFMLSNYFIGLLIDVIIVGFLAGLALSIIGIKNAMIIGFIAGLFNVIPYIGPIITLLFAIFFGVSGCIQFEQYDMIYPTIIKIVITLLSINVLDNLLIQPYIFSNSVKAHPLEIFLVTLMAATLGGIGGMVVAIPVYTLIRVVAKEFLAHSKFFRKLTENIPE